MAFAAWIPNFVERRPKDVGNAKAFRLQTRNIASAADIRARSGWPTFLQRERCAPAGRMDTLNTYRHRRSQAPHICLHRWLQLPFWVERPRGRWVTVNLSLLFLQSGFRKTLEER